MSGTDWYWDSITWEEVNVILSHSPHLTVWDLAMRIKRYTHQNNNHNRKFQAERLIWSQTRGPEAQTAQYKRSRDQIEGRQPMFGPSNENDATGKKAKKLRAKQKKHEKKLLASGTATTTAIDESQSFTADSLYDEYMANRQARNKKWYTFSDGTKSQGLHPIEQQDGYYHMEGHAASRARKATKNAQKIMDLATIEDDRRRPNPDWITRDRPLRTFNKYFQCLPQEIQDEVWRLALKTEYIHVIRISAIKSKVTDEYGQNYEVDGFEFRNNMATPPLLRTCRASRRAALLHYKPAFGTTTSAPKILVNFSMDKIFFDSCGVPAQFQAMFQNMLEEDRAQIKALTCRYTDWQDAQEADNFQFPSLMQGLKALGKVEFYIHPQELTLDCVDRTSERDVKHWLNVTQIRSLREQWKEDYQRFTQLQATHAAISNTSAFTQGVNETTDPDSESEDWDDWVMLPKEFLPTIKLSHSHGIIRGTAWKDRVTKYSEFSDLLILKEKQDFSTNRRHCLWDRDFEVNRNMP